MPDSWHPARKGPLQLALTVKLISDAEMVDSLEAEWRTLFEQMGAPSAFLDFDWVRMTFRRAVSDGASVPLIATVRDNGRLDDVELTRRLVAAGVLMGIDVVDHIVLGDVRYCSFKETGRI